MTKLIPPINFGMVEDDLYRSGFPNELNFPFLEKLALKTIISLGPEDLPQAITNFAADQNIEVIQLGLNTRSDPIQTISEEIVLSALYLILNPKNYPLLVMCNLGRHRTGTLIGCLRKIQRWNLATIFEEYRRFAGSKVRLNNEQFIELFDTDLVQIPEEPPSWL